MKKIRLYLVIMLLTSITFSCSDDDDAGENTSFIGSGTGSVVVDGDNFTLSGGAVVDYGSYNDETFNFDIELLSSDFVLTDDSISGRGENVYFELLTDNATGLKNGIYTFNENGGDFTFISSDVYLDYDFNLDDGTAIDITSGTLEITRAGDNYDLQWNVEGSNGEVITGSYSGTLRLFEETDL